MEDIRYCLESFHMKLAFPLRCFFHPTDALLLAAHRFQQRKKSVPAPQSSPTMALVPRGYENINGYFCPPSDLCRLLPLMALPSDRRTQAQGLLCLEPLLGPVGSCIAWLGHTQTFAGPGAPVHLSSSALHTFESQGISFLPLAAVIWHTAHPKHQAITPDHEHRAFFRLSDKALKK